jgi:hypothetical protein
MDCWHRSRVLEYGLCAVLLSVLLGHGSHGMVGCRMPRARWLCLAPHRNTRTHARTHGHRLSSIIRPHCHAVRQPADEFNVANAAPAMQRLSSIQVRCVPVAEECARSIPSRCTSANQRPTERRRQVRAPSPTLARCERSATTMILVTHKGELTTLCLGQPHASRSNASAQNLRSRTTIDTTARSTPC